MDSLQVTSLREEYPLTLQVLGRTLLPHIYTSVTDSDGNNLAGHVLWHLRRCEQRALVVHGYPDVIRAVTDSQCAIETQYQLERAVQRRSIVAWLGCCWYNRVTERSEKYAKACKSGSLRSQTRTCDTRRELSDAVAQIGGSR